MKEQKLSNQESLDLITTMIQNSKREWNSDPAIY